MKRRIAAAAALAWISAAAAECRVNAELPLALTRAEYSRQAAAPELAAAHPLYFAHPAAPISPDRPDPRYGAMATSPRPRGDKVPAPLVREPPSLESSLRQAVFDNDTAAVHALLESDKVSANACSGATTVLSGAVENVNLEMLEDLMRHGAEVRSAPDAPCKADPLQAVVWRLEEPEGKGPDDGGQTLARISHILLEAGADPNTVSDRETLLHLLARANPSPAQGDIAADFLAHGAQEQDPIYGSALAEAAGRGNIGLVRGLLRDPARVRPSLNQAYLAAAYAPPGPTNYGHKTEIVEAMLDAGADVNARKYPNEPVLSHALGMGGSPAVASVLLAHGADVSSSDRQSVTPLMQAAHDPALLRDLLQHGAEVNAQNSEGSTALHLALTVPQVDVAIDDPRPPSAMFPALDPAVRLASATALLDHGADPNLEDRHHARALNLVPAQDHDIIDRLVARGAQISLDQDEARSQRQQGTVFGPLTLALMEGKPYVAEALLRRDRRIAAEDCGIAYYAAEAGDTALLREAVRFGADTEVRRQDLWYTPLLAAADDGHTDTVQALLGMRGVSVDEAARPPLLVRAAEKRDELWLAGTGMGGAPVRGQTALMLAAKGGHADTVKLLLQHGARRGKTDSVGHTALDYAGTTDVINLLQGR